MLVYLVGKDAAFVDGPPDTSVAPHVSLEPLLCYLDSDSRREITQFRFLRDARRCLLGRLLARHAALAQLGRAGLSWSSFRFERSDRGKPFLVNLPSGVSYNYNVSHDADAVVLAAMTGLRDTVVQVGVDVMRVSVPWEGGSVDELVETMRDQLDPAELIELQSSGSEKEELSLALAYWTLKEAYVKAIGQGLHFDLRRLRFDFDGLECVNKGLPSDFAGQAYLDGAEAVDWRFRLAKLAGQEAEQEYWLALAWRDDGSRGEVELCMQDRPAWLREVSLDELLAKAEPVD